MNTERYEPDPTDIDLADLYDEVWFHPYHEKEGFEVAAPASSLPLPIEELDSFEDDEF